MPYKFPPILTALAAVCAAACCAPCAASPGNDNFAAAQPISGATGSITGSNVGATSEQGEPRWGDGHTVWYRWTAPATGGYGFSTAGSAINNVVQAVSATTPANFLDLGHGASDASNTANVGFYATAGQSYYIAVDGLNGQTGSIVLSWQPSPRNDDQSAATPLFGANVSAVGTTVNATSAPGEATGGDGGTIWYRWSAPSSGVAAFSTRGSAFPAFLQVVDPARGAAYQAYSAPADPSNDATVSFSAAVGATYLIQVDGNGGDEGNAVLTGGLAPANDNFSGALALTTTYGTLIGSNLGASYEPGEPQHNGISGGTSVWFQWTCRASGPVAFNTAGSNFDTLLAAYTGPDVSHLTQVAANDNAGAAATSAISFNAVSGTTYNIAVDGKGAATGRYQLNWSTSAPIVGHIVWRGTPATYAVWDLDSAGNIAPRTFGPIAGWTPAALSAGSDGDLRLGWSAAGGAGAALWNIAGTGAVSASLVNAPAGWLLSSLASGYGGRQEMLWQAADGSSHLWDVGGGAHDDLAWNLGNGWRAAQAAACPDGRRAVLWTNPSGGAALWSVDTSGNVTARAYGPNTGWTPRSIAVGLDGKTRLAWTSPDGRLAIWTLAGDGTYTSAVYGPVTGWTLAGIGVSADGHVHAMWTSPAGALALWDIAPAAQPTARAFGPFSGWTPVGFAPTP